MKLAKHLILFSIGGISYIIVEILFRGYSHQSMFFVGGLCFTLIGLINELIVPNPPILVQMMLSSIIITTIEFVSGCVLNLWMGLNIWNYSNLWGNLLGQIALPFMCAWFFLSAIGILLDDLLRHLIFKEKLPKYKIV